MANDQLVKARVLVKLRFGDKDRQPDDVISGTAAEIKGLQGTVDADKDAVAYAESLKPAAAE